MLSSYHHGDLRTAVLAAAADAVARDGVDALSLRAVAREIGVTHTAPRHHFGDKRGLLTALAADGYRELGARVGAATADGGLLASGLAYIGFAWDRPGQFAVMFRPDLVDSADPALRAASDALTAGLAAGVQGLLARRDPAALTDPEHVQSFARAAWSLVHGFAVLTLAGSVLGAAGPVTTREDLLQHAERSLRHLAPPS